MENSVANLVDYSRQRELETSLEVEPSRLRITIIGCGGIGFWVGIEAAMFGVNEFTLIDGDKIEHSNLNRLPVPQNWIGKNKAIALRKVIRFLRPLTIVSCITKHITEENIEELQAYTDRSGTSNTRHIIIDTTDDARIQKRISDKVKTSSVACIKYVKIGYEGLQVGLYDNMDVWIPDDYRPGYRTTQSNVFSSAIAGGLGLLKILLVNSIGDKRFDLRDLLQTQVTRVENPPITAIPPVEQAAIDMTTRETIELLTRSPYDTNYDWATRYGPNNV